MKKDMFVYIKDILTSIDAIEEYIEGLDYCKFEEDFLTQDAVMMRLSIIGESTAKLTLEFRRSHTDIPWKSMKAVRNLIVHDYSSINLKKIWEIISKDLPTTKKQILQIIP
ncbi:hypothetical protein CO165_02035 [Candidatus Roizmanbacteria bacterium CG_4_9_14_3_um_filter_33_18]|uniref:DUF86 domain-containing protein n=1 Tax=Candidatus Roizmanbacteria bacterium CG_4_9_14_3_um_filter_33_18 TaxID=1974841 RepID=A0A2M7XYB5_9BACT|nr:MAG: hypothetical protein CO165_02035 [Candidatus Roizmanbacteria bacterium CG_4_9_14_3_um_filter_33_18]